MILCCGEALIDMIPEPTLSGAAGFVPHPGGAVFNTAIALGRLGVAAGLLSGVSRDGFGARLCAALAEAGVDMTHLVRSDRPSTLAFVELRDGQAEYQFFDENSAGRMLRPGDLPAIAPAVRALFFGGISLACEPAADSYAGLMARQAPQRVTMLDPNIRPRFIADPAAYRARLAPLLAAADIVKLSQEDLHWLDPGPEPAAAKAAALLKRGPVAVVLTRGGDGAEAFLRAGARLVSPARPVAVADTVGAGDTFNAGLLAELDRAGALADKTRLAALPEAAWQGALDFAARVAAVTVTRRGANPPWARELAAGAAGETGATGGTGAAAPCG